MVDSIINCADAGRSPTRSLISSPTSTAPRSAAAPPAGRRRSSPASTARSSCSSATPGPSPPTTTGSRTGVLDEVERAGARGDGRAGRRGACARDRRSRSLLGGIHSVTIGALRGACRARPARGRGHGAADRRPSRPARRRLPTTTTRDPSRYAHSCVMRRARELGFRTCSVGIRAYSRDEHALRRRRAPAGVRVGPRRRAARSRRSSPRSATERVYLTIDVDGFDPAVAPATGTPVPGGLSWAYGTRLLRELFLAKDVIGADIVEVAPVAGSGAHRIRRGPALLRHSELQAAQAGR